MQASRAPRAGRHPPQSSDRGVSGGSLRTGQTCFTLWSTLGQDKKRHETNCCQPQCGWPRHTWLLHEHQDESIDRRGGNSPEQRLHAHSSSRRPRIVGRFRRRRLAPRSVAISATRGCASLPDPMASHGRWRPESAEPFEHPFGQRRLVPPIRQHPPRLDCELECVERLVEPHAHSPFRADPPQA